MAFDSKLQRQIMGHFATGVTVAGTVVDGETWGMTANAVTSLSLDPPLILLAVGRESQSQAKFQDSGCFALSILGEDQEDISNRFAFAGPKDFSGLETITAETGSPILKSCLGWLDCKVAEIIRGGDHDMFLGEIVAGECLDGKPLLYFGGGYRRIADANDA